MRGQPPDAPDRWAHAFITVDEAWAVGDQTPNVVASREPATLAVKDCIDVAGFPTTAGSAVLAERAVPATHDAACLAGARQAGVRIVGKTNLHELCFGATGVNAHFGTPVNPLDPSRIPGGSSSGSGVAVARGLATVAYGTDTAGSIRNPAACCGVVGVKTTWGRIPTAGSRPLAPSMDTIGVLARDVADAALGMEWLAPRLVIDAITDETKIRVGRIRGIAAKPSIDEAVDAALRRAGCTIVDVQLDGWERAHQAGRTIMYAEACAVNQALIDHDATRLGGDVRDRFAEALAITDEALASARAFKEVWQRQLADAVGPFDALVLPSYLDVPAVIGSHEPSSNMAAVAVSLAGNPALSMPVPTRDGPRTVSGATFPASLQLIGAWNSEEHLLGVGARIERAVLARGV